VTGLPLSQVIQGGYLAAVWPVWTRKAGCKPALRTVAGSGAVSGCAHTLVS